MKKHTWGPSGLAVGCHGQETDPIATLWAAVAWGSGGKLGEVGDVVIKEQEPNNEEKRFD